VALVGLVMATFLADGAAFAGTARMTATHGRSFALALLSVAIVLSLTTFLLLRASGGDDDGGDGREPPEPPWWPEFERAFRDYARTRRRRPGGGVPREPAGRS
jgi:hypothetical protein